MTKQEAEALLTKADNGGKAFFVYQDVADALSAEPDIDMPNKMFARSDVDFAGRPVYVFKRAGTDVQCGDPEKMHMGVDAKGRPATGHKPK